MFHLQRVSKPDAHPKPDDFKPRKRRAVIRVATQKAYEPTVSRWLVCYAPRASNVYLSLTAYEGLADVDFLFEHEFDVVIDAASLADHQRKLSNKVTAPLLCLACGQVSQGRDSWFVCTSQSCRHRTIDGINRAEVVSRLALEQLINWHERNQETKS